MLLRNVLYAVRLQHLSMRAALQNEMALLEAMKEGNDFTVIGFTQENKILTQFAGHWVEV